jgi:hypothetical protein
MARFNWRKVLISTRLELPTTQNVITPCGRLGLVLSKFLQTQSRFIWESFDFQQNSLNSILLGSPTGL